MIKHAIVISLIAFAATACMHKAKQPAPENFIIEQDTTVIWDKLSRHTEPDYFIWFQGGTEEFEPHEQSKFLEWLQAEKPQMICLRGTGGAAKFNTLAERRATQVIDFMQQQHLNVDVLLLDYDPAIRGGRVLVNTVKEPLASQVRQTASIYIINSN